MRSKYIRSKHKYILIVLALLGIALAVQAQKLSLDQPVDIPASI
jgi:hypothetical protein